MYKQVLVVRADLKLKPGKMAAQVAHASLEAALKCERRLVDSWLSEGAKKVVLKVPGERELLELEKAARSAKVKAALIRDAGRTHLEPGTITCIAIGPNSESQVDQLTKDLRLYD